MRSSGDCQSIHPFVRRSVRAHARKLFLSGKIPDACQQDLEQDLYVAFLPRNEKYDPSRSSYRTFVERAVGNCAATLVEAAQAKKRGRQFDTVTFSRLSLETEDGEALDAEDVVGWHRLRNGLMPAVDHDAMIVADVRRAVSALPPPLRESCFSLVVGTISDTAAATGVSRWTVHHRITAIKERFLAAGLGAYIGRTPQISIVSGK
jgi:DNA-directed RNA polymerase specialized sigma24 family protein